MKITINKQGTQIHISSFIKTVKPRELKNLLMVSGETSIGVHGRKYLLLLIGDSSAMPLPPLVMASNIPWLAVRIKK